MDTPRIALPLLEAAQAQKEMTHNEALARIDIAAQAVIVAIAPAAIPATPVLGQCWIVGAAPVGAWAGHASAVAGWTAGGWRFVEAFAGMSVWSIADGTAARFTGTTWAVGASTASTLSIGAQQVVGARQPSVALPTGGSVIDIEARSAMAAIVARLVAHGLIAPV